MPLVTPPVGEVAPLGPFASAPVDPGSMPFVPVRPSSQPEDVGHDEDLQNEMKLQKLDDQFLQLISEVSARRCAAQRVGR